eukprot:3215831-Rhodomonas_salina.6
MRSSRDARARQYGTEAQQKKRRIVGITTREDRSTGRHRTCFYQREDSGIAKVPANMRASTGSADAYTLSQPPRNIQRSQYWKILQELPSYA